MSQGLMPPTQKGNNFTFEEEDDDNKSTKYHSENEEEPKQIGKNKPAPLDTKRYSIASDNISDLPSDGTPSPRLIKDKTPISYATPFITTQQQQQKHDTLLMEHIKKKPETKYISHKLYETREKYKHNPNASYYIPPQQFIQEKYDVNGTIR